MNAKEKEKKAQEVKLRKEQKQKQLDHLTNRILINFSIAIGAYLVLWIFYRYLNMKNLPTFIMAGVFAAGAVVFYILTKVKSRKFLSYANMFTAFTVGTLFTRSSIIATKIMGSQRFSDLIASKFWLKVFNTKTEVIVIAIVGLAYLIGMCIVTGIQMHKVSKS
jgi:ABC-type protease/lipase transport system fused ATPase/permease subunit